MTCRQFAPENRDDPSVLSLHTHPLGIVLFLHRGEPHLDLELIRFEKHLLHDLAGHRAVGLDQQPERQIMVDVGLTDVKDLSVILGENFRQSGSHARAVGTRNINHNKLHGRSLIAFYHHILIYFRL